MSSIRRTTADCCVAIWKRYGTQTFMWSDVWDILRSPAQLHAMTERGYAEEYQRTTGGGRGFRPASYRLTNRTRELVKARKGRL